MASIVNVCIAAAQEPIFFESTPAIFKFFGTGTSLHATASAGTDWQKLNADALRVKKLLLKASDFFENDDDIDGGFL